MTADDNTAIDVPLHTILVPYNLGSLRVGTGAGPEALVANGALDGLAISTVTTIDIRTPAFNEIQRCFEIDAAVAVAARTSSAGLPVVLSGNCNACLGSLAALARPATVIWFDAHGDVNTPDTSVTGFFDGMSLATALGWCWNGMTAAIPHFSAVDEADVMLAGGRDLDPAEQERLDRSGVLHYAPPALHDGDDPAFTAALASRRKAPRAYVHLDLDVLDPSELWANRFKAPGGVSVSWLEAALRAVADHHEVAAVGVSAYDPACTPPQAAGPIVNRLLRAVLRRTAA
jgi:arginase